MNLRNNSGQICTPQGINLLKQSYNLSDLTGFDM
jgi:hypothetical protein